MDPVESDHGWLRVAAGMAAVTLLLLLVGFGLEQLLHTSAARELLTALNSTATTDLIRAEPPATPTGTDPTTAIDKSEEPNAAEARGDRSAVQSRRVVDPSDRTPAATARLFDTRPIRTTPAATSRGMRLRTPAAEAVPAKDERTATIPQTSALTPAEVRDLEMIANTPPPTSEGLAPVPPLEDPIRALRPSGKLETREEESSRIRAVLLRYETAYNRLDAKAASSVWPGVNQIALGRAFDGLVYQKVSLGLCDIMVIGEIAGASCAGQARWEPKVGGGLQIADRYWKFNLRKTDQGWKIQEILVR
jgi:hypothetical protein